MSLIRVICRHLLRVLGMGSYLIGGNPEQGLEELDLIILKNLKIHEK